ncbi:hypothetical protein [Acetobacter syzygii]|uniref:Uncharacterized protein n=1 Tax=Acetobacter syzygii TaxID=146476 RepID=A0A270BQF9_9PROT|nr:hypothetical protein B9K05_04615 [Acetobacter syzygii]PAL27745.1 hypothetical protein B9K04_02905 [Acetobacter syzygii]GAN71634.1 hypothetical protein Absy_021_073 [Acetobacter syzygii]GEL56529.1 hypothetical protein ASY01nite_15950 [Acetobacter syzygii]
MLEFFSCQGRVERGKRPSSASVCYNAGSGAVWLECAGTIDRYLPPGRHVAKRQFDFEGTPE